jgi:Recombination endonuclease VII
VRNTHDRNSEKTHCIHGHEFTPENTYHSVNQLGNPRRQCITCRNRVFAARSRDNHLKRLYNISEEFYDQLLMRQDFKCALCNEESKATGKNARLHVDHDHRTGKVRGLLCYGCNIAIGFLEENPDKVQKVLDYLEFHRG